MHARQLSLSLAVICIVFTWIAPSMRAEAQNASTTQGSIESKAAAAEAPAAKKSSAKSANVKAGLLAALDPAADTLTLRERTGQTGVYVLIAKTHYNKNRRSAERSDFKVGDSIVVHFRRSRTDGAMVVSEMDDPASWTWLSEMRKSTTPAVIREITEDTLSVTVGTENVPLDYSISEKTRWEKGGKEVESSAFKSGDHVFVVPRSLPSGGIMARAVADTTTGAAQEKERLATSVHGAIVSIDASAHKLTLSTLAGDTRSLAYTDDTEVVLAGKPLTLANLRSGQHVAARIRHEAGGDEVVWRITIETAKKAQTSRKRVSIGKKIK